MKMPSKQPGKSLQTATLPAYEHDDDSNFDEIYYNDKKKIECICPKCGQRHKMAFHWIGRGTPRKYCAPCKAGN
jgi:hypothetical protein